MCGIAGILELKRYANLPDLRERLIAMTGMMAHRGPDDEGIFISPDGRVGLGNRRLAIRDLSPAGHMPMTNAEGTLAISYNGEVYNAEELRRELMQEGQAFHSASDTEVILHGYAAWGEGVVQRLRGMFAFAIWDARPETPGTGRLFLARDRLGVKPLYYARVGEAFLFASELKGLLASGLPSRELSPAGLVGYLMLGAVPCPHTIYRDIEALEPGCRLTLALDGSSVPQPEQYWTLPTGTAEPASYGDTVDGVRELLAEAVRIRLVSDVPLGGFLSGGLDSSAVVALMRKATNGPIRTCSMAFEEATYNEAPYARAMAEAVGAEHYERVITARDVECEFDHILCSMDQPTSDGVNTYFVSQTAREAGLTVALSGLGGDELFGGYPNTFQGVPQLLRALPRIQRVPGASLVARAVSGLLPSRHYWAKARGAVARPVSPASAYVARRGVFSPEEVRRLVSPEVWRAAQKVFDPVRHIAGCAIDNPAGAPLSAWISRAELRTYTHHQLLRDTDVMSMAHSLEVRVPLLDHRLVESVLQLPDVSRQPPNGDRPKPLLAAAVGNLLPAAVRNRRYKQGFTFPFDQWMARFRGRVAISNHPNGFLNPAIAEQTWALHASGRMHWSRPWALFVLHRWLDGTA